MAGNAHIMNNYARFYISQITDSVSQRYNDGFPMYNYNGFNYVGTLRPYSNSDIYPDYTEARAFRFSETSFGVSFKPYNEENIRFSAETLRDTSTGASTSTVFSTSYITIDGVKIWYAAYTPTLTYIPSSAYALENLNMSIQNALVAVWDGSLDNHPIHYTHTGCTLSGPLDAPSGQDCVVIVNPSSGYKFTGASNVSIVDALGENVPFIVSGDRISFTMPQF